jgi:hypothetical protein
LGQQLLSVAAGSQVRHLDLDRLLLLGFGELLVVVRQVAVQEGVELQTGR